jgi:hypothetical protein
MVMRKQIICEDASGKVTISICTATDPPGTHPAKDHHDFTKPECEDIKEIAHNLSFQILTNQEIVQWLHDEKQIDLDRSTVTKSRYQINIVLTCQINDTTGDL